MPEECFYISLYLWPLVWFCGGVQTKTPCSATPASARPAHSAHCEDLCEALRSLFLQIFDVFWALFLVRIAPLPWITQSLLSWSLDLSSATFLQHGNSHWWSLQLRQTSAITFLSSSYLPVCNMSSRKPVLLGLSGTSGKKMSPGHSLFLLPSMFVPAWTHIRAFEVPCDSEGLQLWGSFWLFEWSFICSLFLITLPTADTHQSLLVSPPVLSHSSELPSWMVHSKPPCSHVPFLLLLQPLCLDPCLLCLRGSSQVWGRGNFVFIFKSLTVIHSPWECWTHHLLFPCHGALEYWDGKTNWGKGMKDVFLKKFIGKQASVHSFLALILPSVIYTFPCGAPCRGTGEGEV